MAGEPFNTSPPLTPVRFSTEGAWGGAAHADTQTDTGTERQRAGPWESAPEAERQRGGAWGVAGPWRGVAVQKRKRTPVEGTDECTALAAYEEVGSLSLFLSLSFVLSFSLYLSFSLDLDLTFAGSGSP